MSHYSGHYRDGQEIHAGDVFSDGVEEFVVVAVLEWNEWIKGYENWLCELRLLHENGFVYNAPFGIVTAGQSDENFVLVKRGNSTEIVRA